MSDHRLARLFLLSVILCFSFFSPYLTTPVSAETTDPNCVQTITQWTPMAPLPIDTTLGIPRHHIEGGSAVVNGKVYLFTGFADFPQTRPWIDVYDPATNTWETPGTRADMPFDASHISAVEDGNFVWLVGGYLGRHASRTPSERTWRYDTTRDVWESSPLWNLPAGRASNGVIRAGRSLHSLGGLNADRDTTFADHWVLNLDNPDAGWTAAAPLPTARNHLNGVAIDGWVYAVGGQLNHDTNPIDVATVEAYSTVTGMWQPRASLAIARSHFEPGIFILNDRMIVVGGRGNQSNLDEMTNVSEYNPQNNTWKELLPLPIPLIGPTAEAVGNFILVTAGGTNFDQGQSNTWLGTVVTDCVVRASASQLGGFSPAVSDVNISKTGALEAGRGGVAGDQITWAVTVTNNGNVNEEVTITDQIAPQLTIDAVYASRGTVTVSAQTIRVNFFPLPPNETLTITIETTLRERSLTGLLTNIARLNNGRAAQADVRLVPPVTQLPATGETPGVRWLILPALGVIVLLGVLGTHLLLRLHGRILS